MSKITVGAVLILLILPIMAVYGILIDNVTMTLWGLLAIVALIPTYYTLVAICDDKLNPPKPVVKRDAGDAVARIVVSKHLFGLNPIYITADSDVIAKLYRGCEVSIHYPSTGVMYISYYAKIDEDAIPIVLKSEGINYILAGRDSKDLRILYLDSINEINEKNELNDYRNAKSKALGAYAFLFVSGFIASVYIVSKILMF